MITTRICCRRLEVDIGPVAQPWRRLSPHSDSRRGMAKPSPWRDFYDGVSATKVLWVEDAQNAIVKVPIRRLVTCDLDLLGPRRVTYALLQDEGG